MQPLILFQDKHLLVINKPSGLSTELEKHGYLSVEQWARDSFPGSYVGIAHRLDRPTSGVLVLALKKSVLSHLQKQFENKSVKKIYKTLINKGIEPSSGRLEHLLYKDNSIQKALIVTEDAANSQTKHAILHYKKTDWASPLYDELEIELETGRYHQIRAQLSHCGFPVVGDTKYGSAEPYSPAAGIALHAYSLSFEHPVLAKTLTYTSLPSWSL